jgi:uncharacterized protein YcbK (DUF882 family)
MLYTDRLTEHWTVAELCRESDWRVLETNPEAQANLKALAETAAEPLRVLCGYPLICISGYRSPAHNVAVGGAGQSQHMLGKAADLVPASCNWQALRAHYLGHPQFREFTAQMAEDQDKIRDLDVFVEHHLAKELSAIGGVGMYLQSGWVHVDIRPRINGHIARWLGKDFGSEL